MIHQNDWIWIFAEYSKIKEEKKEFQPYIVTGIFFCHHQFDLYLFDECSSNFHFGFLFSFTHGTQLAINKKEKILTENME
ncbi:Alpha-(1,6)-fucosyltransferase, variant 4 [Dermatophagoides farinae]|uniref:Alpha-(1,6)-fucosyltransferase, variant 4 n=1 Tax=Dermatophagoides farinae TaxID=6954 RepID=A0A922HTK9_DERFA|nr:Alpha-(1,6)-fucosyltransferase, variant 4 [Dermatophagoides farinae]